MGARVAWVCCTAAFYYAFYALEVAGVYFYEGHCV